MNGFIKSLIITLFFTQAFSQTELFVQETAEDYSLMSQNTKSLSLNIVLEQGLRKNFHENIRGINKEIFSNDLADAKEKFYFPTVNLKLEASNQRAGTMWSGNRDQNRTGKIPSGSFGLEVDNYNIFNWGKDYLAYLNTKESLQRQIESQSEESRSFRQNLVKLYVKLLYTNDLVKIKKEQLRNASFVYRLNREKVTIKKISKHDYYQARADYLRSQQEFYESKANFLNSCEEMAATIDDPAGTIYIINDEFIHKKINISRGGALKLAYRNSPLLKTAHLHEKVSKRDYEIAIRENMALPKLSIDLGSYKHQFDSGSSSTLFRNSNGGSDIELVASVNATWNIFGDGGVFNRRKIANSRYKKDIAVYGHKHAKRRVEDIVTRIFQRLDIAHDKIKILAARVPSLKKRLDLALNRYLEKRGRYNDFHLALREQTQAEEAKLQIQWQYFIDKITLAQTVGIEDLPGDSFDKVTVKSGLKKKENQ